MVHTIEEAREWLDLQRRGFEVHDGTPPVFFPVASKSVFDGKGGEIPGYIRIERTDTGDTLAVHSDRYSLVPYERHFELFEEAVRGSAELTGLPMLVKTTLDNNGAKIFREYIWPTVTHVIEARSRRVLAFRIVVWDSYDASSSVIARSGFFDFTCANGATIGLLLAEMRFRHTGDMEAKVRVAAEQLTRAAEDFATQARRMNLWAGTVLTAAQVEELVGCIPQASKTLTNEIVTRWAREGDDTLWGVHQALTAWASHDVPVRTQMDRSQRVAQLIEGGDWKSFEKTL